jgi:hypothetical protein
MDLEDIVWEVAKKLPRIMWLRLQTSGGLL